MIGEERDICPECGGEVRLVYVHADGRGLLTETEIERLRMKAVTVTLESDYSERWLSGSPEVRDKIRARAMSHIALSKEPGGCWTWQASMSHGGYPQMNLGAVGTDIRRWLWFDAGGRISDPDTMLVPAEPDPDEPRGRKPGQPPASCGQGAGRRCVRPEHWQTWHRHPLASVATDTPGRAGAGARIPAGAGSDVVAVIEIRNDRRSRVVTFDKWVRGVMRKLVAGVHEQDRDEDGNWVFELEPGMVAFRNSREAQRLNVISTKWLAEHRIEWRRRLPELVAEWEEENLRGDASSITPVIPVNATEAELESLMRALAEDMQNEIFGELPEPDDLWKLSEYTE